MKRANIVIVTPALADANNGNWQTARRWASMLSRAYRVHLAASWQGGGEALMIALHARRSAASVAAWARLKPPAPVVVVMTGTDLYRDISSDLSAQASLQSASALVVLNEMGARSLPAPVRAKARVVLQSCAARKPVAKTQRHLRALMVGHLREEKSPRVYFDAARQLQDRPDILLDHVGVALEQALGHEATALMAECPHYRWLGGVSHLQARQRIQAAHVLVHPSRIEGGAHVVIEAVRSGTPVLASHIDGNVGLLGEDYAGYFAPGDARGLASLLQQLRDKPTMLKRLQQQCSERSALFEPERECATLHSLVAALLGAPPPSLSSIENAHECT